MVHVNVGSCLFTGTISSQSKTQCSHHHDRRFERLRDRNGRASPGTYATYQPAGSVRGFIYPCLYKCPYVWPLPFEHVHRYISPPFPQFFQAPWFENEVLNNSRTDHEQFKENGYNVMGSGKILHHNRPYLWTSFENEADTVRPLLMEKNAFPIPMSLHPLQILDGRWFTRTLYQPRRTYHR